jgi:Base plate wedge protein 53
MYFSNFPTIVYDFKINGKTDYKVITDITRNVRFRKRVLENIAIFDEYDIQDGETPEIISEKVYGTPFYHWIVMIVNQRYDYINDFPLTQREIDSLVEIKYGDKKDHARSYLYEFNGKKHVKEGSWIVDLAESSITGNSLGSINVGQIVTVKDFDYQARVDQIVVPSNNNVMKIMVSMRTGQILTGTSALNIGNSFANVTKIELANNYSLVSNRQYEEQLNEKKRRIKLINPTYIDQILKEFEDIL